MRLNSLLVFVTFNLLGGFDATLSSCCPNKAVGGISYTLVNEGPTSLYGCEEDCVYHPADKPQDRVCFRPGNLKVMCQLDGTELTIDVSDQYKRSRENTSIIMAMAQSRLFSNLTQNQQSAFFDVSKANGLEADPLCKLEQLVECNNQLTMEKCSSSDGTQDFVACAENVCPRCSCSLVDLLGLQCKLEQTVRFLAQSPQSGEEFINLYSSPYAFDQNENFTSYHISYNGILEETKKKVELEENLNAHYAHFASMYNWESLTTEMPAVNRGDNLTVAKLVTNVAGNLVHIINKTKTILLKELKDEILKINLKVDGINLEERDLVADALQNLWQAQANVDFAEDNLNENADETIHRVKWMLYYINHTNVNWPPKKISQYLKFQAKKMSELVARSMNLLNGTIHMYKETTQELFKIKGTLTKFQNFVAHLANTDSAAYKQHVKTIREEVYIPCCIAAGVTGLAWGCLICAAVLETKIDHWKDSLNKNEAILMQNGKISKDLKNKVDGIVSTIEPDLKLIMTWQGALIDVSGINFSFPSSELFGFPVQKPVIISKLNLLKTAAKNYLLDHKS